MEDGESVLSLGVAHYSSKSSGRGLFRYCPLETLYLGRTLNYSSETSCGYSPFYGIQTLKTVTVSDSVASIGSSAFGGCSGLADAVIGSSVTSIGNSSFGGCSSLADITIPSSVTSIGESAFYNCSSFADIIIPSSVTSIGESAFRECSSLTSITIPSSVTSIGEYTFYGCSSLAGITIPNSITSIGNYVFNGCTGLKDLRIENGENTLSLGYNSETSYYNLGKGLFYDCPLENLYLGRTLEYETGDKYGNSPFYGIETFRSLTIGSSMTSIANSMFKDCFDLTNITVEEGNVKYDSRDYCNAIIETETNTLIFGCQNTTIPNSVTSIGNSAFFGCSSLTNIVIPNSVTNIGAYAFNGCSSLAGVTTGNAVTSIGEYAFNGCSNLTSITIPNSVKDIGNKAFDSCSSLTNVIYEAKGLNLGIFSSSSLKSLTIGEKVTNITSSSDLVKVIWLTNTPPSNYTNVKGKINYVANDQYSGLSNVKVYPYLSSLFEVDGLRYVPVNPSERTCDVIDCYYDSTTVNVNVQSTVSYKGVGMTVKEVMPYTCYQNHFIRELTASNQGNIGMSAFYGCDSLSRASLSNNGSIENEAFNGCYKLNEGITKIGASAFSNTALKEVAIPNSVKVLGEKGFYACGALQNLVSGNGLETLANSAFAKCSSLQHIQWGDSIESIGESAFEYCSSLPEITIPHTVNSVGNNAFYGCTVLADVIIEDRTETLLLGCNKYYTSSLPLFSSCHLDSVYIGGRISYDTSSDKGYSPFYQNTALRSVVIGDKEVAINDNQFYGCTNLKNVTIGNGVTEIGDWAFSGCSSLDCFTFGRNVESIGQEAFSDCTNLTQLTSYAAVPPVCGTQALDDINKFSCTLKVPEGSLSAYQIANQWKDFFFMEEVNKVASATHSAPSLVDVYTLQGIRIKTQIPMEELERELPRGIYLVNGKKFIVK